MPIVDQKATYQRHPKPPYSYAAMIILAIENSPEKRLTLAQIHKSLGEMFHFFRDENYTGWKDSVRHNLSQNKYFKKILKDPGRANCKGNFWVVDLTLVSPDVFLRQETDVARNGYWAHELHHQVGMEPVTLNPTLTVRQKEVVFPYALHFNSSIDTARTSSPMMHPKNLNLKRKAISTGCLEEFETQQPEAKRQKRFSFSIASIVRLRSHINAKISKVKKSRQNRPEAIGETKPADGAPNLPNWLRRCQTNLPEEPIKLSDQSTRTIPFYAKTMTRSVSPLSISQPIPLMPKGLTPHRNYSSTRNHEHSLQNPKWLPTYDDFKYPLQLPSATDANGTVNGHLYVQGDWAFDFSHSVYPVNQYSNLTQYKFPCYEEVLI